MKINMKSWLTGLTVLLVMVVFSSAFGPLDVIAQQDASKTLDTVKDVVVELNDDYFNPEEIILPNNRTTKLLLKNKGKKEHTFTVEKLGIDVELQPGEEKTITLKPENPGTYELICRYHVKEGMVGKVIIK
jgi:uncharacterized cupredoxin-like copper-binding protein